MECSIFAQDCPAGQKCMPYSKYGGSAWDASQCSDVARSPDLPGESCEALGGAVSGHDTCSAESMCWDVDSETNIGVCALFCGEPWTFDCPYGFECLTNGDLTIAVCLPNCDPLTDDCPRGETCAPDPFIFECTLGGVGESGSECEISIDCSGLACVDKAHVPGCVGERCCTPWCDLNDAAMCPGEGQTCTPWLEGGEPLSGLEHLGHCGIQGP